jgi:hypothetical protein
VFRFFLAERFDGVKVWLGLKKPQVYTPSPYFKAISQKK